MVVAGGTRLGRSAGGGGRRNGRVNGGGGGRSGGGSGKLMQENQVASKQQ